jgi:chromate transport protein ChrA
LAAVGLLLPSFLIAVAYAIGYSYAADLPAVKPILTGFNAAVIGLLAQRPASVRSWSVFLLPR